MFSFFVTNIADWKVITKRFNCRQRAGTRYNEDGENKKHNIKQGTVSFDWIPT